MSPVAVSDISNMDNHPGWHLLMGGIPVNRFHFCSLGNVEQAGSSMAKSAREEFIKKGRLKIIKYLTQSNSKVLGRGNISLSDQ